MLSQVNQEQEIVFYFVKLPCRLGLAELNYHLELVKLLSNGWKCFKMYQLSLISVGKLHSWLWIQEPTSQFVQKTAIEDDPCSRPYTRTMLWGIPDLSPRSGLPNSARPTCPMWEAAHHRSAFKQFTEQLFTRKTTNCKLTRHIRSSVNPEFFTSQQLPFKVL